MRERALSEEVTFELRLKGGKRVHCVRIGVEGTSGRPSSTGKGPGAENKQGIQRGTGLCV